MANNLSQSNAGKQAKEAPARDSNPPKNRPFLRRDQLAARWICSLETIKRYEKRGILHPVKIAARMLRYRMEEIEALENAATLDRKEVSV
jgi:CHAD domain-containing protein